MCGDDAATHLNSTGEDSSSSQLTVKPVTMHVRGCFALNLVTSRRIESDVSAGA